MSKPDGQTAALRSGRRPGSPDTRQQILDSARKVFAANGFNKASIRKIATNAGVDPALVHHYFRSKDELFLATVDVPINPREVVEQLLRDGTEGLGGRMVTAILGVWDSTAGQRPAGRAPHRYRGSGFDQGAEPVRHRGDHHPAVEALRLPAGRGRTARCAGGLTGTRRHRRPLRAGRGRTSATGQPDVIAANIGPDAADLPHRGAADPPAWVTWSTSSTAYAAPMNNTPTDDTNAGGAPGPSDLATPAGAGVSKPAGADTAPAGSAGRSGDQGTDLRLGALGLGLVGVQHRGGDVRLLGVPDQHGRQVAARSTVGQCLVRHLGRRRRPVHRRAGAR